MDVTGQDGHFIVVGVDGSESSRDALVWAADEARRSGASLRVVMSWEWPYGFYGPAPLPPEYEYHTDSKSILHEAIHKSLGDHPDLQVTAIVEEGRPAPILLKQAIGADLLVVGSRGHGAFSGMLIGSVSSHCVSHASCPVVVVRHLADGQDQR